MRYLQFLIWFTCICWHNSIAQPPATPASWPAGTKPAYVRTWEASTPQSDANGMALKGLAEVKQTTVYYDELGKPIQTVARKASLPTGQPEANATDMVNIEWLDAAGRPSNTYLPFVSTSADGQFKVDGFNEQRVFYNQYWSTHTGETNVQSTNRNWAFAHTKYEETPMNRTLETYAQGAAWVGSNTSANKRGSKIAYFTNVFLDAVRIWDVQEPGSLGVFGNYSTTGAFYTAGTLHKTISTDEHDRHVIVFTDKAGREILRKVQQTATADNGTGSGHSGWLCTYQVYDAMGKLRCTITPRGVELLELNSWSFTTDILNEQCYRYEYDSEDRAVMAKVPGVEPVYTVYDQRNRVVMTQDAHLRPMGKWLVTLYDKFDRPVQTGLWVNTGSNALASVVSNGQTLAAGMFPFNHSSPPASGWERLTRTGYDNYSSFPGVGVTAQYDNTYTNDNNYFITTHNVAPHFAEPIVCNLQTRGQVTWTETKNEVGGYLYTVQFYDHKGRLIQVKKNNTAGGADIITTQFNYSGQPVRMLMRHSAASQTTLALTQYRYDELGRATRTEKKIRNTNVNGDALPADWNTTTSHSYDALGVSIEKKLGGTASNAGSVVQQPIQTLTYSYNVRGWVTGVNRNYLSTNVHSGSTRFGYEITYDGTASVAGQAYTGAAQYNGQIMGITWKSSGDGLRRRYQYDYDGLNQMLKATFTQNNTTNDWGSNKINYTEQLGNGTSTTSAYDANGNIKGLTRFGYQPHTLSSGVIDQLTYHYKAENKSNQLLNVIDAVNNPQTHLGDFRTSTQHSQNKDENTVDYVYDANGNLVKDFNKDIATASNGNGITYNHLNLPTLLQIKKAGGGLAGEIYYYYDATGGKVRKQVKEYGAKVPYGLEGYTAYYISDVTTTTFYADGFVYETKQFSNQYLQTNYSYIMQLQYIHHEEGRIRYQKGTSLPLNKLVYDYHLTDQVGNIRVVLTEEIQAERQYIATLENGQYHEFDYFAELNNDTKAPKPGGFDNNPNNQFLVRMHDKHDEDFRMGPMIILKVMSGDKFKASVKSWYAQGAITTAPRTPSTLVPWVSSVFSEALPSGGKLAGGPATSSLVSSPLDLFMNSRPVNTNRPRAYLNWVLLDELHLTMISSISSAVQVPTIASGEYAKLVQAAGGSEITIPNNGYLVVFLSNESEGTVYFDDLFIQHTPGNLLEEHHYYPTGLEMFALSSSASNGHVRNRYGYQGQERENTFALNLNEFEARHYDPQTGRWMVPDPANQFPSPYVGMGNQWVSGVDPDGRFAFMPILVGAIAGATISTATHATSVFISGGTWKDMNIGRAAAMGALGGALGAGFSQLGQGLGSLGQSMGYEMMSNIATTTAVDLAFGNDITLESLQGAALGGLLDGAIPSFKGFNHSGNYNIWHGLRNGVSELAINTIRGGIIGAISSGLGAAMRDEDVGVAMRSGFSTGAIGAGIRTSFNLAILGPAIRPNGAARSALENMEKEFGINILNGGGAPVYRAGGLMKLFAPGFTTGRSLMVETSTTHAWALNTWVHETYHYAQQHTQTWAGQLGVGMYEQWYESFIKGRSVYSYSIYGDTKNESAANRYANSLYSPFRPKRSR